MSFVGNERKIKVYKPELLDKLQAGLAKHRAEYEKAKANHIHAVRTFLAEALERAKAGDVSDVNVPHELQRPGNFSKDFERAICMIEMSVEGQIEIDENTFKQWVMGEWSWAGNFEASTMAIGSYLSSKGLGRR